MNIDIARKTTRLMNELHKFNCYREFIEENSTYITFEEKDPFQTRSYKPTDDILQEMKKACEIVIQKRIAEIEEEIKNL